MVGVVQLNAQSDSGRIQGTVVDPTGAAIPGATITVTNVETGSVKSTVSDGQGSFSFLSLVRGSYSARVQANGFEKETVNFDLQVSQVKVLNFPLKPGGSNETVEVTSAAPLVDTETSAMGGVVEGKELAELPLNGRNFTQLALLAPGVTKGAYGSTASGVNGNAETFRNGETGGAALSVNGLPPEANNFILDGVDNNESLANTINFFPPVEAMQEFRVSTSNSAAEFGRAGGAVIQASIKSGTNDLHGSAFWFIRNSNVDANPNYFSNAAASAFRRNQAGGTIGGPILKDKLFFFTDYQALRQVQPDGAAINTVPTTRMRSGNFSDLIGTGLTTVPVASYTGCASVKLADGRVVTSTNQLNYGTDNPTKGQVLLADSGAIFDPTTCQQWNYNGIANNIDPTRQNSAAMKYLNVFPTSNYGTGVENNYAHIQNENRNFNDFDGRLDWMATKNDTVFGRYSYGQDIFTKTVSVVGTPSGYAAGDNVAHPRGVVFGESHIFTPNLVNEFRFGYTRPMYGYINPLEGVAWSQNLGILNANRSSLLGGGALIGGWNTELSYTGDGGPYTVPQHMYEYTDSLSWVRKQHTLKVGATIMKRGVDFFQGNDAKGYFFIGSGTGDFTGYEASEVVAGFMDNYQISNVSAYFHTNSWETGYFAQDDWKVNQRLVLNLGIRYDLYTYPVEQDNNQSNFDLSTGTLRRAGVNGNSRSLVDTNFNNWAPRVGFAYDLTGKHNDILRGGYGIFYYQVRGGIGNVLSNNPEFNGTASYSAFSGYRSTFTGMAPNNTNLATNITGTLPLPAFGNSSIETNPTNVNVISYAKHDPTSMIQEWNIQYEHQFGANTVVDAGYVGAKADHETNTYNYTNPQLGTGAKFFASQGLGVTVNTNNGSFNYNALQLRLNRNMAQGLQATVAYTYGHSLDNATGAYSATGSSTIFMTANGPLFSANYGNTDNDQRQAVTVSVLYELPFGRGKMFAHDAPKALDYLIGGWQFNPLWFAGSGTPMNLSVNAVNNVGNRPNYDGGINLGNHGSVTKNGNHYVKWFDPGVFSVPSVNTSGNYIAPGNTARNRFRGPGYDQLTASIFKNIPIWNRVVGQLRFEAYNLTNTPQFTNPDSNVSPSEANAGLISGTRAHSERELQGAFRITF
jgi:hypothetical protein